MRSLAHLLLLLTLCVVITGCDGNGEVTVTGTVTFDAVPIPHGSVKFVNSNGTGSPAGAVITEGRFQTKLMPGKYKLEVNAQKVIGKRTQKGFDGKDEVIETTDEMIPVWYNAMTELTEEVKATPAAIKLDLKSKK